ncbi:MurR/RpiR family transcriptional regulator [Dolosicoccus paucivorans]|uniref:MurR/RpiR family transcriptional regulator n=1 Tax=Dolosicoccus paucivorans TaxID=84521 RepID=UPI0011AFCEB2|nr:MurR/RpiR family transcriptional regulator [Dolosicoccus paucivorans]
MRKKFIEEHINQARSTLSQTEIKIANYFITNSDEVIHQTLEHIASNINVSESSIFKFVKKIGFRGFQEFKIEVAKQADKEVYPLLTMQPTKFEEIHNQDSAFTIAEKVVKSNLYTLTNCLANINKSQLERVLSMIDKASTLHFFGIGGSQVIALDSYHKFNRSAKRCNYIFDYHLQLGYISRLNEKDTVFIFSHSGSSKEMVNLAKQISQTSAKLIALTGNSESKLLEYCDESLIVITDESIFRTESLTARICYLTLMDALYINLMYQDFEKNFANVQNVRKNVNSSRDSSDRS